MIFPWSSPMKSTSFQRRSKRINGARNSAALAACQRGADAPWRAAVEMLEARLTGFPFENHAVLRTVEAAKIDDG